LKTFYLQCRQNITFTIWHKYFNVTSYEVKYILCLYTALFSYGMPNLAEFSVHMLYRNIGTEKGTCKREEHVSDHQQVVQPDYKLLAQYRFYSHNTVLFCHCVMWSRSDQLDFNNSVWGMKICNIILSC
jgi:hypothetical protein